VNRPDSALGPEESDNVVVTKGLGTEPERDDDWDAFVAAAPYGHLMQTSRWGALKARFGWTVERLAVFEGDVIVAGAQVLYRSLPLNLGRLAYVPMGPVVDWTDDGRVGAVLGVLQRAVGKQRAFCLKVEPAVLDDPDHAAKLLSRGFSPSPQTVQWRSTILVDLDCAEDEILARFGKEHRRKVRKAAREGITVRPGTAADIPAFYELLGETAERKEFAAYPPDYYRASYDLLAAEGLGQLFVATWEDAILAGTLIFTMGTTAYMMFAASSKLHRELYPTYLLQWEAIRWAHARGCLVYDFCGIPDEVGEDPDRYAHEGRHDGMWGVYRFKRGFGGQVAGYLGTHDQVYNRSLYYLYSHAIHFLENGLGETWNRKLFSG
jgi:peptidoglycan pentaglycine glycine transferase (the first glycine)